jgi:hypothetical protein
MSAKTDESGVENYICLNYFRFLGPIAEWEKKVGSMDLVRLSGGLLVKYSLDQLNYLWLTHDAKMYRIMSIRIWRKSAFNGKDKKNSRHYAYMIENKFTVEISQTDAARFFKSKRKRNANAPHVR